MSLSEAIKATNTERLSTPSAGNVPNNAKKVFIRASKSILDESTTGGNLSSEEEDEYESAYRTAASSTFSFPSVPTSNAAAAGDRLGGLLKNNR